MLKNIRMPGILKTSYKASSIFFSIFQEDNKKKLGNRNRDNLQLASGRNKLSISWIPMDLQSNKPLNPHSAVGKILADKLCHNSLSVYEKANKENFILEGKKPQNPKT